MTAHRLAEERSLALHRAVVERIREHPDELERARGRVRAWLEDGSVHERYAVRWARLLEGPRDALLDLLVDPGEEARALRQVTPFAGLVGPRERWRIWREVRSRLRDAG